MKHINKKPIYQWIAVLLSVCAIAATCTGCSVAGTAFLFSQTTYMKESSADDQAGRFVTEHAEEQEMTSPFLVASYLQAKKLCFTKQDVIPEQAAPLDVSAGGLFDINHQQVRYAKNLYGRCTPASVTKILTAYVVFKYGNLDDVMTASSNVEIKEEGAKLCGLKAGDQMTVRDGLYGLLVYSGNDVAVMLAEHISGSVEAFCKLMNEEAKKLGATDTHFVNPHGLTAPEHYTTAYDLYLIFQELIQNDQFMEIIQTPSYTCQYTAAGSNAKVTATWETSNRYLAGVTKEPEGVHVMGGKTGYTLSAGGCLILLVEDEEKNPYIAIALNTKNKDEIYQQMNGLLSEISK